MHTHSLYDRVQLSDCFGEREVLVVNLQWRTNPGQQSPIREV